MNDDFLANAKPVAPQQDFLANAKPTTATPPPAEGFWHSLGAQFGLTPEAAKAAAQDEKDHPIKSALWTALGPAGQVAKGLYEQAKQSGGEIGQAYQAAKEGNTASAAQHAITAVPIVGPALAKGADQYGAGDYAGAAGTLVGASAQAAPIVAGGIEKVAPNAISAPVSSVSNAASAAKAKLYPTSQSLASNVSAARNLSKALVVSPQAAPNFVRAATDEAGTVVDFAQKNNLPINSKVDFANAAEATAKAVQDHFNENILRPNAKEVVSVPSDYRGSKLNVEGSRATIGDINNRINAINQELNPNFRKGLASQTSAANVSDADLIAEKGALTNILHDKLAAATGLQPSDIAAVRQQAGKLRTVADEANLSANQDTAAAGKQAMGATTSAVGTKVGMIDRGLQMVQGGPEVIGNRQVLSALKDIQPKPLNLPQPTSTGPAGTPVPRAPVSGGPSTTVQGPDYTPDPNAAAILRARIAGRLKPAPVPVQPPPQLQLPAQTGGAYVVPNSVVPQMTAGERVAAMMQYLRQHPRAALPAKAGAIPLPPPK